MQSVILKITFDATPNSAGDPELAQCPFCQASTEIYVTTFGALPYSEPGTSYDEKPGCNHFSHTDGEAAVFVGTQLELDETEAP